MRENHKNYSVYIEIIDYLIIPGQQSFVRYLGDYTNSGNHEYSNLI